VAFITCGLRGTPRYAALRLCPAVLLAVIVSRAARAQDYGWALPPAKAEIMVISAHPDDEGIFFGGALPYYTQVRRLALVHISMTSGDYVLAPQVREGELRCADWTYGLRFEPLFPRFRDYPTQTLNQTWDIWADGVLDGDDVAAGRYAAASYVAQQIRRYRPEVILTHDLDGEYGHANHKATAWATADAANLAADATESLGGLEPWQAKKLYTHLYNRTSTQPMLNRLYHDWSTPCPELAGSTPLQVADAGLACHASQGGAQLPSQWAGRRFAEQWGLYASSVGADTLGPDGVAHGDFFEHVPLDTVRVGDANCDGSVDFADINPFVRALIGQAVYVANHPDCRWLNADIDGDGDVNFDDIRPFVKCLVAGQCP